jgi:AbiV family abortive infection protein
VTNGSTWLGATRLYEAGAHPLAAAISITALEETGKLAVERFRLVGVKTIDMAGLPPPESLGGRASAASFFRHTDKHVLAAMSGALINNRLDRVLGVDYINWFLEAAELGALEQLRQNCLYAEMAAGNLQEPSDHMPAGDGARLVALAGEVLAEVAGVEPGVWERLLTEVQAFEKSVGLPSQ